MPPTENPQSTPAQTTQQQGAFGPFFAIIIILALMLAGAFYFWGRALNQRDQNPPPYIPEEATAQS
jgi:uncharacterized protein HemX